MAMMQSKKHLDIDALKGVVRIGVLLAAELDHNDEDELLQHALGPHFDPGPVGVEHLEQVDEQLVAAAARSRQGSRLA